MRLFVTETPVEDVSFDMVNMSVAEFNNVSCHLFIVSQDFDEVVIELSDKVNLGMIRPLMSRTKVIPKVPADMTSHIISLLCEMYPEKSAELRYAFIRDKSKANTVVTDMCKENGWAQFY